jgi:hypothetical protein
LVVLVVSPSFSPVPYMHSYSPPFVLHASPSHPHWLDHSNYTWRRVQVMKLLIMQFTQPTVPSSFCGKNFLHSTLFSSILSLCKSKSKVKLSP